MPGSAAAPVTIRAGTPTSWPTAQCGRWWSVVRAGRRRHRARRGRRWKDRSRAQRGSGRPTGRCTHGRPGRWWPTPRLRPTIAA
jgi:hypothetical protein